MTYSTPGRWLIQFLFLDLIISEGTKQTRNTQNLIWRLQSITKWRPQQICCGVNIHFLSEGFEKSSLLYYVVLSVAPPSSPTKSILFCHKMHITGLLKHNFGCIFSLKHMCESHASNAPSHICQIIQQFVGLILGSKQTQNMTVFHLCMYVFL